MKTPMQGAQAVVQCALDPKLEGQCGKYFRYCFFPNKYIVFIFILFSDMKEEPIVSNATNEKEAKRLWLISQRWTRLTK